MPRPSVRCFKTTTASRCGPCSTQRGPTCSRHSMSCVRSSPPRATCSFTTAGHGVFNDEIKRGYWVPVDADTDADTYWISSTELSDQVNLIKSTHILIVADSCYAAALTRSGIGTLETGRTLSEELDYYKRVVKLKARVALTSGGLRPVLDSARWRALGLREGAARCAEGRTVASWPRSSFTRSSNRAWCWLRNNRRATSRFRTTPQYASPITMAATSFSCRKRNSPPRLAVAYGA